LFGPLTPENDVMALAQILEDPASTRDLIKSLTEVSQH
jgi:hypothetical protein